MTDEVNKQVNEVKAFARGIHISPRKVRLVADMIRNMPISSAFTVLEFTNKKSTLPIRKLLASAAANAKNNFQIDEDKLFVKSIAVDQGPVFMRYAPRAQGRAFPIRKRTSHIGLVLGINKNLKKTGSHAPAAVKKEDRKHEPAAEAKVPEEQEVKGKAREKHKKHEMDDAQAPKN